MPMLPQRQGGYFPTAKKACDCFHLWSISSEAVQKKYVKSQHGHNEQDMQPWHQTIRVILWTPDEVPEVQPYNRSTIIKIMLLLIWKARNYDFDWQEMSS